MRHLTSSFLIAAALTLNTGVAIADTELFSSGFGDVNTTIVSDGGNWTDGDDDGNHCEINDATQLPGAPTDQHARMEKRCAITSASILIPACHTAFFLNYYWRGDLDAEVGDTLLVQVSYDDGVGYRTLV